MSGGGFIPQPYTQYRSNDGIGPGFIPQYSNLFGNSSPLTGGKMFGSNPYYSSSHPTQFQSFIPRSYIPGNNVYGGGSNPYNFQQIWNSVPPPKIPFLATLNFPDLSKLINDPIRHSPAWPPILTKVPSDIPKFKGKVNEDPNTHIMTFHLWCSSNSLMEDNIRFRLFQRNLMGVAANWYIELPTTSFVYFRNLGNVFLHHFQLPIQYDFRIDLLTSFQQGDATHISNHIHAWRRRRREIKENIPYSFLLDWFLKSLHPQICKYVTMMGPQSEEQAIHVAHQLDLIYSQSRLLYSILPNAPQPLMNPSKPTPSAHVDGMIGLAINQVTNVLSQVSLQSNAPASQATPASKVFNIQTSKKGGQKGKTKIEKKEKNANTIGNSGNNDKDEDEGDNKKKRKVKFPCKLCNDFHLTHFCPKLAEAKRLLDQKNTTQQPIVLSNPFPHPNQKMVVNVGYQPTPQGGNHSSSTQGAGPYNTDPTIYMMEANVSIQTRAKN